jgi:serine/threonine protein kinase
MNTLNDWPRVKRVLERALACEGSKRQAYLDQACGTDAVLRARIETLLAAADRVGTFLEKPAVVLLQTQVHEDLSGRAVHAYQLVSRLGAGGMSEVYLAHDTKLDRPVALKFLSPELAADRSRLRRFHQEARAASSLNHPHIVVVHDFGELDGRPYIVTEFIEGETLRQRLQRGPLPVCDVVEIGVQMASALAAAHARGLVHRDIKPENIMLRPDGYAKVLDFGLAKLATATYSPNQIGVESRTEPGMVVGTPRYMSPEQARGVDLDARSDVWSLGVVLYEMATARLPFAEKGSAFSADRDVRLATSDSAHRDLPPELLAIICTALQTVRDLRYASGAELCEELKRIHRDATHLRSNETHSMVQGLWRRGASLRPGTLTLAALIVIALAALVSVRSIRSDRVTIPGGVQKTVAVLPFENVDENRDIDYLRLALADEVATSLSWAPTLAVRPVASSLRFGAGVSPQQAGWQLRVGGIVTGHFSIHQSELRVTVEAVEVDGNRLLWRDTIATRTDDAITLRDRLTSRIRSGLLPALGAGTPTATHARPQNAEAYSLYLKSLASSRDPERNREAIAMLQRASSLEPDYADTWVSLADRYYYDGHYGGGGIEALRRSEAAARQALALDPNGTAAATRLLSLQVEAGRLQDGYDSARQLLAQHPDSGEAGFALSYVLRYGGLFQESASECDQAVSRDPTNPLFRTCAMPFMLLGRYDRALDYVRLDAGSEWARLVTRFIYQRMGRRNDARDQHARLAPEYLRGMAPEIFHGLISRCLAGDPPDRQGQLTDDDVRTFLNVREDPEPLYFWASDLAYCGHPGPAVQLLRESIRRNYCACAAIDVDPAFASIRNRAEYGELLEAARACRRRFREHVVARPRTP